MKRLGILSVALLMFVGLARPANAQVDGFEVNVTVRAHIGVVAGSPSDKFLSFGGPIEIPGVGLPPGTYIFRTLTPSIMQVVSEDRSMVYAMFFVTPAQRSEATDKFTVTLRRIRDDAPLQVTTIFPPDSRNGYELPYPATLGVGLIARR